MRRLMVAAMIVGLTGCAATPEQRAQSERAAANDQAELDKQLVGLMPGATTSCLPNYASNIGTTAYGPTILYRVSRGLVYRNDTAGGCETAGKGGILVTRQYQGRACRGDIAVTIDQASRFQTGSCSLGDFTEYRVRK